MHGHSRPDRHRRATVKATVSMPVIALAVAALATACGTAGPQHAAAWPRANAPPRAAVVPQSTAAARTTGTAQAIGGVQVSARPGVVQAVRVPATQIARLPMATTNGTTPKAPQDPAPFGAETGTVLHPATTRIIFARPGGPAVAVLPATELGSQTWVPVVQSQPGWDRILLPSRPDRSTGWIYLGGGGLQTAHTPYQVNVNLADYRLTLLDAGRILGTWTVAEGSPGTPTPRGRTFVLASLVPLQPTYSPLILPLGTHSNTLTTYGGGPGTVGLHGWPDPSVFGHAVSHGCVRVPAAALQALSLVPLGSPVVITG
jgi:L,D-transpeptidase catalytic domain